MGRLAVALTVLVLCVCLVQCAPQVNTKLGTAREVKGSGGAGRFDRLSNGYEGPSGGLVGQRDDQYGLTGGNGRSDGQEQRQQESNIRGSGQQQQGRKQQDSDGIGGRRGDFGRLDGSESSSRNEKQQGYVGGKQQRPAPGVFGGEGAFGKGVQLPPGGNVGGDGPQIGLGEQKRSDMIEGHLVRVLERLGLKSQRSGGQQEQLGPSGSGDLGDQISSGSGSRDVVRGGQRQQRGFSGSTSFSGSGRPGSGSGDGHQQQQGSSDKQQQMFSGPSGGREGFGGSGSRSGDGRQQQGGSGNGEQPRSRSGGLGGEGGAVEGEHTPTGDPEGGVGLQNRQGEQPKSRDTVEGLVARVLESFSLRSQRGGGQQQQQGPGETGGFSGQSGSGSDTGESGLGGQELYQQQSRPDGGGGVSGPSGSESSSGDGHQQQEQGLGYEKQQGSSSRDGGHGGLGGFEVGFGDGRQQEGSGDGDEQQRSGLGGFGDGEQVPSGDTEGGNGQQSIVGTPERSYDMVQGLVARVLESFGLSSQSGGGQQQQEEFGGPVGLSDQIDSGSYSRNSGQQQYQQQLESDGRGSSRGPGGSRNGSGGGHQQQQGSVEKVEGLVARVLERMSLRSQRGGRQQQHHGAGGPGDFGGHRGQGRDFGYNETGGQQQQQGFGGRVGLSGIGGSGSGSGDSNKQQQGSGNKKQQGSGSRDGGHDGFGGLDGSGSSSGDRRQQQEMSGHGRQQLLSRSDGFVGKGGSSDGGQLPTDDPRGGAGPQGRLGKQERSSGAVEGLVALARALQRFGLRSQSGGRQKQEQGSGVTGGSSNQNDSGSSSRDGGYGGQQQQQEQQGSSGSGGFSGPSGSESGSINAEQQHVGSSDGAQQQNPRPDGIGGKGDTTEEQFPPGSPVGGEGSQGRLSKQEKPSDTVGVLVARVLQRFGLRNQNVGGQQQQRGSGVIGASSGQSGLGNYGFGGPDEFRSGSGDGRQQQKESGHGRQHQRTRPGGLGVEGDPSDSKQLPTGVSKGGEGPRGRLGKQERSSKTVEGLVAHVLERFGLTSQRGGRQKQQQRSSGTGASSGQSGSESSSRDGGSSGQQQQEQEAGGRGSYNVPGGSGSGSGDHQVQQGSGDKQQQGSGNRGAGRGGFGGSDGFGTGSRDGRLQLEESDHGRQDQRHRPSVFDGKDGFSDGEQLSLGGSEGDGGLQGGLSKLERAPEVVEGLVSRVLQRFGLRNQTVGGLKQQQGSGVTVGYNSQSGSTSGSRDGGSSGQQQRQEQQGPGGSRSGSVDGQQQHGSGDEQQQGYGGRGGRRGVFGGPGDFGSVSGDGRLQVGSSDGAQQQSPRPGGTGGEGGAAEEQLLSGIPVGNERPQGRLGKQEKPSDTVGALVARILENFGLRNKLGGSEQQGSGGLGGSSVQSGPGNGFGDNGPAGQPQHQQQQGSGGSDGVLGDFGGSGSGSGDKRVQKEWSSDAGQQQWPMPSGFLRDRGSSDRKQLEHSVERPPGGMGEQEWSPDTVEGLVSRVLQNFGLKSQLGYGQHQQQRGSDSRAGLGGQSGPGSGFRDGDRAEHEEEQNQQQQASGGYGGFNESSGSGNGSADGQQQQQQQQQGFGVEQQHGYSGLIGRRGGFIDPGSYGSGSGDGRQQQEGSGDREQTQWPRLGGFDGEGDSSNGEQHPPGRFEGGEGLQGGRGEQEGSHDTFVRLFARVLENFDPTSQRVEGQQQQQGSGDSGGFHDQSSSINSVRDGGHGGQQQHDFGGPGVFSELSGSKSGYDDETQQQQGSSHKQQQQTPSPGGFGGVGGSCDGYQLPPSGSEVGEGLKVRPGEQESSVDTFEGLFVRVLEGFGLKSQRGCGGGRGGFGGLSGSRSGSDDRQQQNQDSSDARQQCPTPCGFGGEVGAGDGKQLPISGPEVGTGSQGGSGEQEISSPEAERLLTRVLEALTQEGSEIRQGGSGSNYGRHSGNGQDGSQ